MNDVYCLDFINQLRPVSYNLDLDAIDDFFVEKYNQRDSSRSVRGYAKKQLRQSGLIAQEVESTSKYLGFDFSGIDAPQHENDYYGLRYAKFTVPLVKAVQELSRENERLNLPGDHFRI